MECDIGILFYVEEILPFQFTVFDTASRIGLIVRNSKGLRVPINQRSYAWKCSHVEDLFIDLNGAATKNAEEYFLGSTVVVVPDKNGLSGQQFGATLCRICVVISRPRGKFYD